MAGRSFVAVRLLPRKSTRSDDGGWASAADPPRSAPSATADAATRRIFTIEL
jgi:hypothetical protein